MEQLANQLLREVKQNKKYSTIADEVVIEEINAYLNKNNLEKISKEDIKNIRSNLHKNYSSFQTKHKKNIPNLLNKLKNNQQDNQIIYNLLSITLSTKERQDYYKFIYKKIFEITKTPKTILDLGCGLNPFSIPLMNLKELNYYCYDIDLNDIKYLNEFFEIINNNKIKAKAGILDLRKNKLNEMPNSDIIFLFKVIDLLDKENHKPSEELIKHLINKTNYIVASFATKTITRKQMNRPNRLWFELMLERNNLNFQTFKIPNEIFYIISK